MSAQSGEGRGASSVRAVPVELVDVHPGTVLVLGAAAALAAAGWAVVTIAPDMVTTLAVGVVLGVAISPLSAAVQRRFNRSRIAAAAIVGISLALLFGAVVVLVAPAAVDQASEFSEELPATVRELYSWPIVGHRLEDADAAGEVEDAIADLPATIDDETLAALGERLLGGAFSTLVVLIVATGVMADGEVIVRRLRAVVPPARQERADEVGRIVYHAFGSYFAGSLTVAVLNGIFVLSLGLLLGVPLAPIAAIWAALTNLIPQIGGFLGGGFFVLLALTDSPTKAVIAGVLFLAYQQFENNIVQPAIVGSAVNLTPPATMMAALIGGAAAGVPGALVATPLLGAGKALYLESRGRLPIRRDAALRRRLHARLERVKQAAEELTESITE
ncbi:MAG: AI-2E family transporter [Acidimicrobiales bacterium]